MDENAYLHVYVVSKRHTYIQLSPVATGAFGGLNPPKQSTKLPKLNYETL